MCREKESRLFVTHWPKAHLNLSTTTCLVLVGLVAIASPVISGVTDDSALRAQTHAPPKQEISGAGQGKLPLQGPNGELRLVEPRDPNAFPGIGFGREPGVITLFGRNTGLNGVANGLQSNIR